MARSGHRGLGRLPARHEHPLDQLACGTGHPVAGSGRHVPRFMGKSPSFMRWMSGSACTPSTRKMEKYGATLSEDAGHEGNLCQPLRLLPGTGPALHGAAGQDGTGHPVPRPQAPATDDPVRFCRRDGSRGEIHHLPLKGPTWCSSATCRSPSPRCPAARVPPALVHLTDLPRLTGNRCLSKITGRPSLSACSSPHPRMFPPIACRHHISTIYFENDETAPFCSLFIQ